MLSAIAAEHVQNPRNRGALENATHVGTCGTPGDGPYVRIWLLIKDGRIEKANYNTHGCPSSVASASMTAALVAGRTVEQASRLTEVDLMKILGGLPEGKEQFATFAVRALHSALEEK
jgi:nitrogen fixation protein NifU and related proteins